MADGLGISTRQVVPVPEPQGHIDTSAPPMPREDEGDPQSLMLLHAWATQGGNIADMLPPGELSRLGAEAIRQWHDDASSRKDWVEKATHYLDLAAQETDDDERDPIWENAADVHYPILSTATGQFLARASPELIKGDKVVGVKVFSPPSMKPDALEQAKEGPQPQDDQQAKVAAQQLQQAQLEANQADLKTKARNARAERVKHYLNFVIFYEMDHWEEDSDLLILQASAIGSGFKKVYMGERGLQSDFTSATCLVVHNDAKSLTTCPRITQEFDAYPNEIEERKRAGVYSKIELPSIGPDPEQPRRFIEQHRLDDLDEDGLAEPYIVTVDVDTQQVMSVVPAYTTDDIMINPQSNQVIRIDRWQPFAQFTFLPDPRGRFYGIGLGQLLDSITASIDTTMNQLIDAGTAQIAGGGFIGSGVRLQGSGQGGSVFFSPGEYQTVSSQGIDLRQAIWERTLPGASPVALQMLEMLLGAAKDIASIKDVITGEAPSTAPVGTTLALQNQALQVFSSIYKRIYRGFHDEFRLMYKCLKRWATAEQKAKYQELTGGNFDEDFSGDGTDIQPVADPTVVTKMQKIAKMQTVLQLAESPVGMAAGMTQAGPAQALILDSLDVLDIDRPERFVAPVPPNPELVAKVQDTNAAAGLKQAQTQEVGAKIQHLGAQTNKTDAAANVDRAKVLETIGNVGHITHGLHVVADQIHQSGDMQPPEPEGSETK